ncbi:nucleotide-diphospho-sugar transferase [Bimuria novae-zelandiae CBS 107.79]|uniref:Nucleotide-diphospho-sugar transferase n=1 Tax=Bimuria novae-zelandiae CBS 107.79 TaxID=1447943 RepID=A0A6A5V673_9PLEO|nr:nucleotide-diphospho-sugar transferase [Bimuria novae-zelandiae CBS 107.79]
MRTVISLVIIAVVLIALSSFTEAPSRIQHFSPQDLYGSSKENVPPSNPNRLETQLTSSLPTKSATSSPPKPIEKIDGGSGQPKETSNESDLPHGKSPKPIPHTKQPPDTGNGQPQQKPDAVVWSSFAYVQYVTNSNYLCNSLMVLEELHRLGTKAERIMMYPQHWSIPKGQADTEEARFLLQARDNYKAELVPIEVVTFEDRGDATWKDSYTKLLAFNQTQYKRVISLDSDAIVRQTMDELFFLPSTPVAMPRAYWLDQPFLSSQLLVIEPSTTEWTRVSDYMSTNPKGGFDMDILNTLYKNTALVLPHRRYDLLTSEFRKEPNQHEPYLSTQEKWNGTKVLEEVKFVHFSDWPVRKPWLMDEEGREESKPKCHKVGNEMDCTDRDIWVELYSGYAAKRKEICGREYDLRRRATGMERRTQRMREVPAWFEAIVT